jgi:cysteine desulfurase
MGVPVEAAHGSLRFSLDIDNDEEQIDYIIEKVHEVVALYRSMSPYWEDLENGKREHCVPEYWKPNM